MEELEQVNDIPDGIARIEALDNALKTAEVGEDRDQILERAELYYAFLTKGRVVKWTGEVLN